MRRTVSSACCAPAPDGGFIACLHTVDAGAGQATARIVRYDADAQPVEILFEEPVTAAATSCATAVFSACSGPGLPGVAVRGAAGSRIIALDAETTGAAIAFADAARGAITLLAREADHLVGVDTVQAGGEFSQSLLRVGTRGPARVAQCLDVSPLGLSNRRRVTAVFDHGGWLHAAVADPVAGFDIFRQQPNADSPTWEPLMLRGGHRFALNAAVSAVLQTPEGTLIGTAALAGGGQTIGNWGPELILLPPGGGWDLVVGQARFSPDGLRLPASALPAGIDSTENVAVKALASGAPGGRRTVYMAIQAFRDESVEDRRAVFPDFRSYAGTVRVFSSQDLVSWEEIPVDLPSDAGAVSGLCVTGAGLVVAHEGSEAGTVPLTILPLS